MKTGLTKLISTEKISKFLLSYKQNEPFLVDQSDALSELRSLPFLSNLETLIESWNDPIQAHLPDLRDESSSVDTTKKDAIKLFNNGMGLLFNEAQNLSPVLIEWLQAIRKDLDLSALTYGRCLIYATPDGKGTAPHFDQNINFVLQIHGTKVWQMAPNEHVINPLTRFAMNGEVDPEMMNYIDSPMPTKMPSNVTSYELRPGSVLFVPRGYWHSTTAEGDALALNFTFTPPTWIDLFTAALRSRLSMSPEWRETAHMTGEDRLDNLLVELSHELPHWRASGILSATEGSDQ